MREIKCLMVMPMHTPQVTTLEVSMKAFSKAVSIGSEEDLRLTAKKIGKNTYILYAADALFAELAANRNVNGEIISGTFYVVAVDKERIPVSLSEEQMMRYMMMFYEPERYSYRDVVTNWSKYMMKELECLSV